MLITSEVFFIKLRDILFIHEIHPQIVAYSLWFSVWKILLSSEPTATIEFMICSHCFVRKNTLNGICVIPLF